MPRVLIADDEDSMRTLVARAIAMDGHETVTAEDGAEALEILTREDGAFDLLLTDIQMPVMDGIALALTAARFSRSDDPVDDGFCRSARTRPRPQCDRPRRGDETVFGGRYPHRRGRCAGRAEGLDQAAPRSPHSQLVMPRASGVSSTPRPFGSIIDVSGILDRPLSLSRAMTVKQPDCSSNPSAAARGNRARSAGGPGRRGGGAVLPESGAPAGRRSRRGSSP